MQQVTVWRCHYRETSSNRCSGIAVTEDGMTNHLHCSNLFSANFIFIWFSFPDGAWLLWNSCAMSWSGDGAIFLDTPKALMGLSELQGPICSWASGAPWINIPNSLCAWISHAQHHLLVLSLGPARKAFLLLKRKCLNMRFLHPYGTFNSVPLEIQLVWASCPRCS